MPMKGILTALVSFAMCAGCGDNLTPGGVDGVHDAPTGDASATDDGGDPSDAAIDAPDIDAAAIVDGIACGDSTDCAAGSECLDDPLEHPGGECQVVDCTVGNDATCAAGGDGHCVDLAAITSGVATGTGCVDACTDDGECRQAEGYVCHDGGPNVGHYCRHPQAGDPCTTDASCGDAAQWDCKTGLTFPGGMCTPTTGCPTPGDDTGCSPGSSACYDSVLPAVSADNVCVARCGGPAGTQGGCRAGYVCRDVDPSPGSGAVVLGCVNP
jgi:hypothetical protein